MSKHKLAGLPSIIKANTMHNYIFINKKICIIKSVAVIFLQQM